jgi:glycosyltransferase involved in cell wall biosynthesis
MQSFAMDNPAHCNDANSKNCFPQTEWNNKMISVVMPVRNSINTISEALTHLLASPHVGEILVSDGGSTDGTVDRILRIVDKRVRLVSTTDTGIYNGANKALLECKGDYILFMNANDFLNPKYLDAVMRTEGWEQADYFYGCTSSEGKIIVPRIIRRGTGLSVRQTMPFPHVSMIVKASVHHNILGGYDESFRISADLDYINRLFLSGARGVYVPEIAAECSLGGVSSGFGHILEARRAAIKSGKSAITASIFSAATAIYRIFRR